MTLASHGSSIIDTAAGIGVLTSLATTGAVFLQYLPPFAAIASVIVSLLAAFWYGIQIYDWLKSKPPK